MSGDSNTDSANSASSTASTNSGTPQSAGIEGIVSAAPNISFFNLVAVYILCYGQASEDSSKIESDKLNNAVTILNEVFPGLSETAIRQFITAFNELHHKGEMAWVDQFFVELGDFFAENKVLTKGIFKHLYSNLTLELSPESKELLNVFVQKCAGVGALNFLKELLGEELLYEKVSPAPTLPSAAVSTATPPPGMGASPQSRPKPEPPTPLKLPPIPSQPEVSVQYVIAELCKMENEGGSPLISPLKKAGLTGITDRDEVIQYLANLTIAGEKAGKKWGQKKAEEQYKKASDAVVAEKAKNAAASAKSAKPGKPSKLAKPGNTASGAQPASAKPAAPVEEQTASFGQPSQDLTYTEPLTKGEDIKAKREFVSHATAMRAAFAIPPKGGTSKNISYAESIFSDDKKTTSIKFTDCQTGIHLTTQTPATVKGAAYSEQINPKADATKAYMAMFEHAQAASATYPGGILQIHEIKPAENAQAFMDACRAFQEQNKKAGIHMLFNIQLDRSARDALTPEQQNEFDKMPKVELNQVADHRAMFPALKHAVQDSGGVKSLVATTEVPPTSTAKKTPRPRV